MSNASIKNLLLVPFSISNFTEIDSFPATETSSIMVVISGAVMVNLILTI